MPRGVHERFVPVPEVGQVILGATCGSAAQPFWLFQEKCFQCFASLAYIYKKICWWGDTPAGSLELRAVLFSFFIYMHLR